jgi:hypothetical protein
MSYKVLAYYECGNTTTFYSSGYMVLLDEIGWVYFDKSFEIMIL